MRVDMPAGYGPGGPFGKRALEGPLTFPSNDARFPSRRYRTVLNKVQRGLQACPGPLSLPHEPVLGNVDPSRGQRVWAGIELLTPRGVNRAPGPALRPKRPPGLAREAKRPLWASMGPGPIDWSTGPYYRARARLRGRETRPRNLPTRLRARRPRALPYRPTGPAQAHSPEQRGL